MRVIRIARFLQEDDQINWLVDSLLPDVGWTLLVGKQGIGKSTFVMQLCAAIQLGVPFMGRKTQQSDIMYVQADSPAIEWREMLRRIAPKSLGWTMVDVPAKCLGNPAYVASINNLTEKVKPGFIVFDSLYNLTSTPINSEGVLLPINIMKAIAGNVPWLLIHHPPHSETRAAGHHSVAANCSNEWHLLRNKLKVEKGRLVKDKEILLSRDDKGLWISRDKDTRGSEDILLHTIV